MKPLREAPFGFRVAITLFVLVLSGGFLASFGHMHKHHQNRDGQEGLSYDDIQGVYTGVRSVAPLKRALDAGHPSEIEGATALPEAKRKALLDWLAIEAESKRSSKFDDFDLGENAPAEILSANCVQCHSRSSNNPAAGKRPLEYYDEVAKLSISRDIAPMDQAILLATTHTHAIALGTTSLVLVLLLLLTRWGALAGTIAALSSLGLTADLAGWWLARDSAAFIPIILGGGGLFGLMTALLLVLIVLDLWLPSQGNK
ncbi:MAG: hypothetical protein CSA62_01930 [Planctomycetota bacterium]|nr:MAG: hypothetical protein CSA62_01930 [Planctomycetota bacterium]